MVDVNSIRIDAPRKLSAQRARAESPAERQPQRTHAVGVAHTVGQSTALMNRDRVIGDELDLRPIIEAIANSVAEGKERIDVAAAGEPGAIRIAFQIGVVDDSTVEFDDLMKAAARADVKRRHQCGHVEMGIAIAARRAIGAGNGKRRSEINEWNA